MSFSSSTATNKRISSYNHNHNHRRRLRRLQYHQIIINKNKNKLMKKTMMMASSSFENKSNTKETKREDLFMGIDFGTSGCRISIINERGSQKFETQVKYTDIREEAEAEKEKCDEVTNNKTMTDIWESALWQSLENIPLEIRELIVSVAIDGTSGTVIIVNPENGEPLFKAMMYNEKFESGAKFLAGANRAPNGHVTRSSTSALSKLAHYYATINDDDANVGSLEENHHQNQNHSKSTTKDGRKSSSSPYKLLHHADWLSYKLHEDMVGISDFNNALKLGFDPGSESYPEWMLQLPFAHALPKKVLPPGTRIGPIQSKRGKQLLPNPNCVVVTGTTDSVAAFIASGANKPGDACTSLGSTLAWKLISETRVDDGSVGIYSHKISNQYWLVGGACNTGGNILRAFFSNDELETLTEQIKEGKIFNDDLKNYYSKYNVREADFFKSSGGGDFGLEVSDAVKTCEHERTKCDGNEAVFLCKIFVSIAKAEKRCYDNANMMGASEKVAKVYTSGGGAANESWCKIRSTCLTGTRTMTSSSQINDYDDAEKEEENVVDVVASEYTEASYGTALLSRQGYLESETYEIFL
jgi:D-ribulokinase